MQTARTAVAEVGDHHPIVVSCQRELGHKLPLSSYLLKPVQRYIVRQEDTSKGRLCRLTKYQLLLADLLSSCHPRLPGRFELQDSLESVLKVIKSVNDSLHQVNIVGLPPILHPLGSLVCQESLLSFYQN